MKRIILLTLAFLAVSSAAQAACYADYKAKRDDPLRLHYGVAEIMGACSLEGALVELTPRLAADNWQLLNILGVFEDDGLEERQANAGEYYLRYLIAPDRQQSCRRWNFSDRCHIGDRRDFVVREPARCQRV